MLKMESGGEGRAKSRIKESPGTYSIPQKRTQNSGDQRLGLYGRVFVCDEPLADMLNMRNKSRYINYNVLKGGFDGGAFYSGYQADIVGELNSINRCTETGHRSRCDTG